MGSGDREGSRKPKEEAALQVGSDGVLDWGEGVLCRPTQDTQHPGE